MTNQEFDNYLTLLGSLLQLRGEQREAIAGELRAHLEDRLDELLARGYDRDEAVRLALEEFGDAAGLAANFSLLVRNRRRRWIVKVTSFSTAALVLLAIGLMAIWPEHRPGPAPPQAVAQNVIPDFESPKPADPAKIVRTVVGGDNALEEKLSERLDADFSDTPLKDVLQYLADSSEVQIFVNRRAFEEEGLELDVPISISLKNVRLDLLLDLVLEQATSGSATYVERDGILIVSTLSKLEGANEVRVYNCRDLLSMDMPKFGPAAKGAETGGGGGFFGAMLPGSEGAMMGAPGGMAASGMSGMPMGAGMGPGGGMGGGGMGGGGMGGGGMGGGGEEKFLTEEERRAEALSSLIQTAVKPESWQEQGGYGTISSYGGLFVINHNSKTHKQIENVLKMLREAAAVDQTKVTKVRPH